MSSQQPKLVEVYRTPKLAEAHSIKMALEAEGLQVFLDGEMLQGGLGELPLGWSTGLRVSVPDTDLRRAEELIAEMESQILQSLATPEASLCLACSSPMDDNQTVCTNCGWTFLEKIDQE
jgi:hypothetical protein